MIDSKETCSDVEIEPELQVVEKEIIEWLTENNAKADIGARGCWHNDQNSQFEDN